LVRNLVLAQKPNCRGGECPRSWRDGAGHGQVLQGGQGLWGYRLSRSSGRPGRVGSFQRHRDGRLPVPGGRRPGRVRLRGGPAGQLPLRRDLGPQAMTRASATVASAAGQVTVHPVAWSPSAGTMGTCATGGGGGSPVPSTGWRVAWPCTASPAALTLSSWGNC